MPWNNDAVEWKEHIVVGFKWHRMIKMFSAESGMTCSTAARYRKQNDGQQNS